MIMTTAPQATPLVDLPDPAFLEAWLATWRRAVEAALEDLLAEGSGPEPLREAMRYSLLAGGKRLRPLLALAGAEAVGGDPGAALGVACALECVHTYSLIHDDLPAMDDDDLRRGRPTCHRACGEATAILAGDGLLTHAFELLTAPRLRARIGTDACADMVAWLARAAGPAGMVGGQLLDMRAEGRAPSLDALREVHAGKTGRLLAASVTLGARTATSDPDVLGALDTYGRALGLAFQVVDDILDQTADTETLGKPQGSDARNDKATYPALLGLDGARAEARRLVDEALGALAPFDDRARPLRALASFVLTRTH